MADEDTGTALDENTKVGGASKAKKISVALFSNRRRPSDEEEKAGGVHLGTIYGEARGWRPYSWTDAKTGEQHLDEQITGEFFADLESGETITSGTLYLPDGFHQELLDQVAPIDDNVGQRKKNGNVVRFAYDIFCIQRDKAAYSFKIQPVYETKKEGTVNLQHQLRNALTVAKEKIKHSKTLGAPAKGAKTA